MPSNWFSWRSTPESVRVLLFVRYYETGGERSSSPARRRGRLAPIAAPDEPQNTAAAGHVPGLHPAALFLLMTFLAILACSAKSLLRMALPGGTVFGVSLARDGAFSAAIFAAARVDLALRGLSTSCWASYCAVGHVGRAIRTFLEAPTAWLTTSRC